MARRWIDAASAADIGRLDPQAIARVREEAWPDAGTADELCDALSWLTFLTDDEVRGHEGWPRLIDELIATGRVVRIEDGGHSSLWVATDRRALFEPQLPS